MSERITRGNVEARIAAIVRVAENVGVSDISSGAVSLLHVQSDSGTNRLQIFCYDDGPTPWRTLPNGRGYSSGVTNLINGTMREIYTYLGGVLEMLYSLPDVRKG